MATYLPTSNDDAQRQQAVSAFFWTAANILGGTDTALRVDPNVYRADGQLGPVGSATNYGVGPNGEIYVRGSTGQIYQATQSPAAQGTAPAAGFTLTPGLLMILAAAAFFFLRK